MSLKIRSRLFLLLTLLRALCPSAHAWVTDGQPLWPTGTVQVYLRLSEYTKASHPEFQADEIAKTAIESWNPFMDRLALATSVDAAVGTPVFGNGRSEVYFSDTVDGVPFPAGEKAVTLVDCANTERREVDIVVNPSFISADMSTGVVLSGALAQKSIAKSSYWGASSQLSYLLRREAGRLLGLSYPDSAGQSVSSCMNKRQDASYRQTDDDQVGIASLYGEGPLSHLPEIFHVSRSEELELGEELTLTVDCDYHSSVQWYKDGVPIDGATSETYKIASATAEAAGVYTMRAFNEWKSVTSTPIVVTVFTTPQVPRILSQSVGGTWKEGYAISLNVFTRSGSPVKYQWYKNGIALSGATSAAFSIGSAMPSDAGTYRVDMTNDVGTRSSSDMVVEVALPDLPSITDLPYELLTMEQGKKGSCSFSFGGVNCSYYWVKDGVPLSAPQLYEPPVRLPADAPSATLNFEEAQPIHEGLYHLEVSNRAGTVASKPVRISVMAPAIAPMFVLPSEVYVDLGARLDIIGVNSRFPDDVYTWYRDGLPTSHHGSDLRIYSVESSDAGTYQLMVANKKGVARSSLCRVVVGSRNVQARSGIIDGILYLLAADRRSIERFNINDGSILAPIPLPANTVGDRISVGASGICVVPVADVLYYYSFSDASWEPNTYVDARYSMQVFTSGSDSLYYLQERDLSTSRLSAYRLVPSEDRSILLADAVNTGGVPLSLQLSVDGSHFFGIFEIRTGQGFSFAPFTLPIASPSSALKVGDYVAERTTCAWVSGGGRFLVTDGGVVFDAVTLRKLRHLERPVQHFAAVGDSGDFLLSDNCILKLDTDASLEAWAPAPAGAVMLLSDGKALRVLVRDAAGVSSVVPFDPGIMEEGFPPRTVPVAPLSNTPVCDVDGAFVGKDGLLRLIDVLGAQMLTWSPAGKTLTEVLSLRGRPKDFWHDADRDVLFFAYEGGLVTRLPLSAGAREQTLLHTPGEIQSITAAAGKLFIWSDQVGPDSLLCSSLNSFDAESGAALSSTRPIGGGGSGFPARYTADPSGSAFYYLSYDDAPIVRRFSADTAGLPNFDCPLTRFVPGAYGFYYSAKSSLVFRHSPSGEQVLSDSALQLDFHYSSSAYTRLSHGTFLLNATTLEVLGRVSDRDTVDAQWTSDATPRPLLLSIAKGGAQVARRSPNLDIEEASLELDCAPRRLSILADGTLLVVGLRAGIPRLYQLAGDLSKVLWSGSLDTRSSLVNLSIQADVGSGDDILVPGFVVEGSSPKTIMVRSVGPGLNAFGLSGLLPDPGLTLFGSEQGALATNAGWTNGADVRYVKIRAEQVGAFPLSDSSPDSVLMHTALPGTFTAEVKGISGGGGRCLVELYDLVEASGDSRFVNMSARCKVSPSSVAIGGFVIHGDKPMKLLVRAVGPKLADYQVKGVLPDPRITLYRGLKAIASNDNWGTDATTQAAHQAACDVTGAFELPRGSKDAALIVELEPGNYTVWMESTDGSSGVALLEIYEVP